MESGELYLALTGPTGRVAGNVQADGYAEQIDLLSWNWGAELSKELSEASAAGGKNSNRAEPKVLTLTKRFDRSSTVLMSGAANLTKFPKAVITLLHRVDHALKLTVALEGVRITRYDLKVADSQTAVTMEETIDLSAEVIRIEYAGRSSDGVKAAPVRSFELRI